MYAVVHVTFTVPNTAEELSDTEFENEIHSKFNLSLATGNPLLIDSSSIQITGKKSLHEQHLP